MRSAAMVGAWAQDTIGPEQWTIWGGEEREQGKGGGGPAASMLHLVPLHSDPVDDGGNDNREGHGYLGY